METISTGAIDIKECPDWPRACRCPKCVLCGFGLHYAVHGPYFGAAPGSKPYNHQYKLKNDAGVELRNLGKQMLKLI